MASAFAPPRTRPIAAPAIRTLRPTDVTSLRLPGARGAAALKQSLEQYPGRSVWSPETIEYALLAPWRHRPDIANVDELNAVRHVEPLLHAALERCAEHGDELMMLIDLDSDRRPSRFERAGLDLLEEVITYELPISYGAWRSPGPLREEPVVSGDNAAIDHLLRIDHQAFPWLWQNNRTEFEVYLGTPGASVSLLTVDGTPVAYFGATHFPGWSHLDRIAVAPSAQGQSFGRQALSIAIGEMRRAGARRVALSTQRTNWRSQRLYERFGFRRTPELDYRLFGAWCRPERARTLHEAEHVRG